MTIHSPVKILVPCWVTPWKDCTRDRRDTCASYDCATFQEAKAGKFGQSLMETALDMCPVCGISETYYRNTFGEEHKCSTL